MKAKDKTTGAIIDVAPAFGGYFSYNGELIPRGDLEFNFTPPQPETTISGWLARTMKGELIFSDKPPVGKSNVIWHYREGTDVRLLSELELFGNDIFPTLTWQDEPIEVEITIKPKNK